ncbi:MAG TPA: STAS domain-containing protein [Candidatus Limnocylindrales bacterium]|jgi:anti-anti-sigma factor|nr:STAS domain-containing protein [Candidatus Limnocylindrales bacterium]
MAMQTRVDRVDAGVPVTVMALDGELDASNYLRLVDDVRELYASGTRNLLLDLTDLSFIASSGLVALYSVVQVMNGEEPPDPEHGWGAFREVSRGVEQGNVQTAVQLCGAQPAVAEVLQRTGLDRLFRMHPDRESAVASF